MWSDLKFMVRRELQWSLRYWHARLENSYYWYLDRANY